jgi:hypothetical protein
MQLENGVQNASCLNLPFVGANMLYRPGKYDPLDGHITSTPMLQKNNVESHYQLQNSGCTMPLQFPNPSAIENLDGKFLWNSLEKKTNQVFDWWTSGETNCILPNATSAMVDMAPKYKY